MKERRTEVEGWRASVAVESGVTWKRVSGAQKSSKAVVGHSEVPEVGRRTTVPYAVPLPRSIRAKQWYGTKLRRHRIVCVCTPDGEPP